MRTVGEIANEVVSCHPEFDFQAMVAKLPSEMLEYGVHSARTVYGKLLDEMHKEHNDLAGQLEQKMGVKDDTDEGLSILSDVIEHKSIAQACGVEPIAERYHFLWHFLDGCSYEEGTMV